MLRIPYELKIGVTGHRRLADEKAVEDAVDRLLDAIVETLTPDETAPLEWVVISPLARGADRIVARSILRRPSSRLQVVAPFSLEEYRKDFDSPGDRQEFETLLALDESPVVLEPEGDPCKMDFRRRAYRAVGEATIQSCELLVALWDGEPACAEGGTGDIVRRALESGRSIAWLPTKELEGGARLLVPIGEEHQGDSGELPPHRTYELPTAPKLLSPGHHQLSSFLRDRTASARRIAAVEVAESKSVSDLARSIDLGDDRRDALLTHLLPYRARAEALARGHQTRHFWAIRAIYCFSALAVSMLAIQALLLPDKHWAGGIGVVAMLGALATVFLDRHQAWHEKWIHDRYLAEHLRSSLYTLPVESGRPASHVTSAENTLPFYAGPEAWLPTAIHRIVQAADESMPAAAERDLEPLRRFVVDGLLRDQQQWHERNADEKDRSHALARRIVIVLFSATLATATLHVFGVGSTLSSHPAHSIANWLALLAVSLPAWGAAVHAIDESLENRRIASRSRRMAQILGVFSRRAESTQSTEGLSAVVRDASFVLGLENYEWSVLLSFKPPELVA